MSLFQQPPRRMSVVVAESGHVLLQYKEGFDPIHKAAAQNFHTKVKKYITASPSLKERRAQTQSKMTPLLVAATYGAYETFHLLVKLDADLNAQTSDGLTAVQCAAINRHTKIVTSLIRSTEVNIFHEMFTFISVFPHEPHSKDCPKTSVLKVLAFVVREYISKQPSSRMSRLYQTKIKSAGGIQVMSELIKDCVTNKLLEIKLGHTATNIVLNMSQCHMLGWEILKSPLLQQLLHLLKTMESSEGCISIIKTFGILTKSYPDGCTIMTSLGTPGVVLKIIKTHTNEVLRLSALENMQFCVRNNQLLEYMYRERHLSEIIDLMNMPDIGNKHLISVIKIIKLMASSNEEIRSSIVDLGAVSTLVEKFYIRSQKVAENIVDLLNTLCVNRGDTENALKESPHAVNTLIYMASHSINPSIQYKSFKILWSTAGEEESEKRALASLLGPSSLLTFISLASEDLQFIATMAIKLLSPPLYGMQDEITARGGVISLLKVIRLAPSNIQLEALLALESLSYQLALRPNKAIQVSFIETDGIQLLLRLSTNSQLHKIRLQAVCTLAAMSTGNVKIKGAIMHDSKFNLYELIDYLNTMSPEVDKVLLLVVNKAISYLAYNSIDIQYAIIHTKKLPLKPFQQLLHSSDKYISTETAFQMIVLQRVFETIENQTLMLARCIQHICKELKLAIQRRDVKLQVHICSLVMSLLHIRAGILSAFLALDIVALLVRVLLSPYEHCRRTAAIALSYITTNPRGSRIILGYCRKTPKIFLRLKDYTNGYPLHEEFLEGWEHYRSTHLLGKVGTRGISPQVAPSAFIGSKLFRK